MPDDYANIPGSVFNEGAPRAGAGDYPDPAAIYEGFSDMYGGPFGRFMAQNGPLGFSPPSEPIGPLGGGVTGPPDEWGGSSGYVGGADSTPYSGGSDNTPPARHGGGQTPSAAQQLYNDSKKLADAVQAQAPRQANSGLWGVAGYSWTGKWPAPQQTKADKYHTMPQKHHLGPRLDPSLEQIPEYSQDFGVFRNSPYENEVPYQYFRRIGDVVTFPGNPANDNNPTGPGGAPHNWDNYRRQAALARAIAAQLQGNLGQDHFFGP